MSTQGKRLALVAGVAVAAMAVVAGMGIVTLAEVLAGQG
jgi:hypothetical protein